MKVLVIAPQYRPRGQYYELPLGLAYISSFLKTHKIETDFLNLNEENLDVEKVFKADVICTGGLSVHYHSVKSLLAEVKEIKRSVITVVGGGLFSSMPDLVYRMLSPYIDIGVSGEGEEALKDAIILGDLKRGKIEVNEPIRNLDSLPFPDYEGMKVQGYLDRQLCGDEHYLYPLDHPRCLPIISSRSCPYNCSFCFHPTGRIYRQRSLDNFFSEVEFLIEKYQINMLAVLDELISQFPERINLFCQRIKKYKLKWMTQMRVDSVNQDTIKMLKDSGCFQISYGIEHVNRKVLEGYNKKITLDQIEKILKITYEEGIGIQGNILIGSPQETPQTIQEAQSWVEKNSKYMVNLSLVIPYPGTQLFDTGIERGLINPRNFMEQGCPFINFPGLEIKVPEPVLRWGELINQEPICTDPSRGVIMRITAICPHCTEVNKYEGLYWGATGANFTGKRSYRIACRNCNQRFDLRRW
jgi:anaerobic magnesium-protoporphyrin IX monomethyl ester cyclase